MARESVSKQKKNYLAPSLKVEKISIKLFRRGSLMDEVREFNLLAADESDISDDY